MVKKRETERQAEMRLSSYAYLEALEREEPWRQLAANAPNSGAADAAWSALLRCAGAGLQGRACGGRSG